MNLKLYQASLVKGSGLELSNILRISGRHSQKVAKVRQQSQKVLLFLGLLCNITRGKGIRKECRPQYQWPEPKNEGVVDSVTPMWAQITRDI